jgi:hypothetical protein
LDGNFGSEELGNIREVWTFFCNMFANMFCV